MREAKRRGHSRERIHAESDPGPNLGAAELCPRRQRPRPADVERSAHEREHRRADNDSDPDADAADHQHARGALRGRRGDVAP